MNKSCLLKPWTAPALLMVSLLLGGCGGGGTAGTGTGEDAIQVADPEFICTGALDDPGCAEGFYCSFPEGSCGEDAQEGICTPRPEVCTLEFAAVCGCDGVEYGNSCAAATAGVSLRAAQPCQK